MSNRKIISKFELIQLLKADEKDDEIQIGSVNKQIVIEDCEIENEEFLSKSIVIDGFKIKSDKSLVFNHCKFKELQIGNFESSGLYLTNVNIDTLIIFGTFQNLFIRNCTIKNLQITSTNANLLFISNLNVLSRFDLLISNIKSCLIDESQINIFSIKGDSSEKVELDIDFVKTDQFYLYDFSENVIFSLNNIQPYFKNKSKISIRNSVFPNTKFINCNFKIFKYLEVCNNNLTGIKSENTKWFKKIIDWENKPINFISKLLFFIGKDFSIQSITAYRQLKHSMQNQHDYINEIYFRSKEYDAYLKQLPFWSNFSESVLLWANRLSNRHGYSWSRGVIFSFCVSIVFYIFYVLSLKNYPFTYGWISVTDFMGILPDIIGYYSRFFIITHAYDFMKETCPTGYSYLIDSLSRIFIGYGIYQTVQAFRKYGK